jgi:hypothetical protein
MMARHDVAVLPSDLEIRAALDRVVASVTLRRSPRLVSFLCFVVETTLAGQANRIKGYLIAVEALGRKDDFDPQSNPIVRVEAGRLRRARLNNTMLDLAGTIRSSSKFHVGITFRHSAAVEWVTA